MVKGGAVYIMTNKNNTTLYTGVTNNLLNRVLEHKNNKYPNSFTSRYNLYKLVYYSVFSTINEAIMEEKRIKGGSRKQKENLINEQNPTWKDLCDEVNQW
ncbi:MAG: GIY-YIG nuclease family protein [Bacteroidota bacterium]|nr:GIY-YIG nuclease family protein [Bacteroidota bacterium]